jgi:hypothetical protein
MGGSWNLNTNVIEGLSGDGRKRFMLVELISKVNVMSTLE